MTRHERSGSIGILGVLSVLVGLGWAPAARAADAPAGSIDVEEAVRVALRQNPDFRRAVAAVGAYEGARLDALAGILPGASGSYAYSKSHSTTTLKGLDLQILVNDTYPNGTVVRRGDLPLDSDSHDTGFGVTLREDIGFSSWYRYRSAQADVQGARYSREDAAQQLAYSVREQFYLVLRAQDLLTVQQEDLRLARDEERRINSMFELGSVARVDVLKSRVRVSDAEVALIRQQNAVDIEKSRLATLLGYTPDTRLQLAGDLQVPGAPVDSASAADEAETRPDLMAAREAVRSANNLYRSAALSRVPSLFASFDVNTSTGGSERDNVTRQTFPETPGAGDTTLVLYDFPVSSDSDFDGWTFRVGATVSLDAFLNMGQHKRARSNLKQQQYQLATRELAAQQELEEAILNYRASVSAIQAADRGVESAEEDLRLSEERYQQGLGTVLELLESQVNLTKARNSRVNALTGLKISEAALDRARGAPVPN